jgi:purine nucleoside phosphorylase
VKPPPDVRPDEAVAVIRTETEVIPSVAVILGSGQSEAVSSLDVDAALGFEELPGFPRPAVPGHPGRLVVGHLQGVAVAAFLGRIHPTRAIPCTYARSPCSWPATWGPRC